MFINCRHCNALVATDPATDLPPERCPRCAGVLRLPAAPAAAAGPAAAGGAGTPLRDPSTNRTAALRPAAGPAEDMQAAASVNASAVQQDRRVPAQALVQPAAHSTSAQAAEPSGPAMSPTAGSGRAPADIAAAVPPDAAAGRNAIDASTDAASNAAAPASGEPPAAASPIAPPEDMSARGDASSLPASASPAPVFSGRRATAARARRLRGWAQPAAVAGLVVLLGLQIVLADRARLAADAQWRPLVETVCSVLGCSVPPWREPQAFVLLARDVRPHPQQAGALRASASFRNDAAWPQPWPQLVLTLSDLDGHAVAVRAFAPEEYLGAAPRSGLVASGQSVDIALDILEPSRETVSYAWDLR